jgi:UDP-2,3-diacylglucosamine hydrolase
MGEEKEDLIRYAGTVLKNEKTDYFIFGHRHLAMTFKMKEGAEIIFLGDWIKNSSFAEWDGKNLFLRILP